MHRCRLSHLASFACMRASDAATLVAVRPREPLESIISCRIFANFFEKYKDCENYGLLRSFACIESVPWTGVFALASRECSISWRSFVCIESVPWTDVFALASRECSISWRSFVCIESVPWTDIFALASLECSRSWRSLVCFESVPWTDVFALASRECSGSGGLSPAPGKPAFGLSFALV